MPGVSKPLGREEGGGEGERSGRPAARASSTKTGTLRRRQRSQESSGLLARKVASFSDGTHRALSGTKQLSTLRLSRSLTHSHAHKTIAPNMFVSQKIAPVTE